MKLEGGKGMPNPNVDRSEPPRPAGKKRSAAKKAAKKKR